MRRTALIVLAAFAVLGAQPICAQAQTPRLEWNANPEADVAGYIVSYGLTAGAQTASVDVGNTTHWVLTGLQPGRTYFFTVRAYNTANAVSQPSSPASFDVPATPLVVAGPRSGLLWRHDTTGHLSSWIIEGTRQVSGASLTPGLVADPNWQIVATADFDGDGERDLVWQHADGTVSAWLMRNNSLRDGRLLEPSGVGDPEWRVVAAGDMNRDGSSDLIWRNRRTGVMAVWLMDGTRRIDGLLLSPDTVADMNWEIIGAADFDLDGQTDLLWRNKAEGWLSVWHMNGIIMREGKSLSPNGVIDLGWSIRAVNDINGDSWPDLIWQHVDGRISAWIMNGLTMIQGVILTPGSVADPGWKIVGAR